ncbi:hypothetical protein CDL15_Pgr025942 [Punica granatum]|uniref:Uncharacterized protein n=1 Tax=Punica granatum TaxID=22663 RepID=A0A218WDE2_PUNGR|nr:hypothetical protein CDL15_Pgr025942 [Punica granatum]
MMMMGAGHGNDHAPLCFRSSLTQEPLDGIFRSLRPPLVLPRDHNLSIFSFLIKNYVSYPEKPALIDAYFGETLTYS